MKSPTSLLVEEVMAGGNVDESINDYLDMISTASKQLGGVAAELGKEALKKSGQVALYRAVELPDAVAKGVGKKLDKVFKKVGKLPEKGVATLVKTLTGNRGRKISKKASEIRRSVATYNFPKHIIKAHENNIRGIIRDLSKGRIREKDALDLLDAALRSIEAEKMAAGVPAYSGGSLAWQDMS